MDRNAILMPMEPFWPQTNNLLFLNVSKICFYLAGLIGIFDIRKKAQAV